MSLKGIKKVLDSENFDMKVVKSVLDELNNSGVLDKKINPVGKKKEAVIELFMAAIESVPEEKDSEIPVNCVKLYNAYLDVLEDRVIDIEYKPEGEEGTEEEIEEETEEKPEKKSKKKADKAPKEKKEKVKKEKTEVEKSCFGHRADSQAGKIDELLSKGKSTLAEVAEVIGCNVARVSTHVAHLKKNGLAITVDEKKKTVKVE